MTLQDFKLKMISELSSIYEMDQLNSIFNLLSEYYLKIPRSKILIANEATSILHGANASKDSRETAETTFSKGGIGKNIPERKISKDSVVKGINILDLIFQNDLLSSKSEARRVIKNK